MSRTPKPMGRMPMALRVHRVTHDGVPLPTSAVVTPLPDSSEPGHLHCECGQGSGCDEWGSESEPNAVGPRCPYCGNQYELDVPKLPAELPPAELPPAEPVTPVEVQPEPEATSDGPPLVVRIEGDSLANAGALSETRRLNDEWLDLDLRLELLADEKRAFVSKWNKDRDEVRKRIGEIKAELRAIKRGDTYQAPPEPEPRQPQLPGIGG